MPELTHFNNKGQAYMVDIGAKDSTKRIAIARAFVRMSSTTLALVDQGNAKKGDVLNVARVAGIMAAKKTSDLIPLCHPLSLSTVGIEFERDNTKSGIHIIAQVQTQGKTGVEMEALTAATVTALTLYDMLKSAEKTLSIENIHLALKDGGKSGRYQAQ